MNPNIMVYLSQALSLLPYVTAGVEKIHSDLSGADKKTAAVDALSLVSAGASALAPQYQAEIGIATEGAAAAIDAVVKVSNLVGLFTHKSAPSVVPAYTPAQGGVAAAA